MPIDPKNIAPIATASTACAVKACPGTSPATWRPVIKLWVHKGHDPMLVSVGLVVCAECILAGHIKLEHFLTDELWTVLCAGAKAARVQNPKRELTELDFIDANEKSFDPALMRAKARVIIDGETGESKEVV